MSSYFRLDKIERTLKMPFTVSDSNSKGRTAVVDGIDVLVQKIIFTLYTRVGSRPMRRRLGSDFSNIILRPVNTHVETQLTYYINDALRNINLDDNIIKDINIDWKSFDNDVGIVPVSIRFYNTNNRNEFDVTFLWKIVG